MLRRLLPMSLLLLAGCAVHPGNTPDGPSPREAGEIADALKGLTPGQPVTCIDQSLIQNVRKFTDTVLYEYSPREIYRVTTTPGCTGLSYDDTIVSHTTSDQLCRGDIIHTVSPGAPGLTGTCALESFVPYRR